MKNYRVVKKAFFVVLLSLSHVIHLGFDDMPQHSQAAVRQSSAVLSRAHMLDYINQHIRKLGFHDVGHQELQRLQEKPLMHIHDMYQQCKLQSMGKLDQEKQEDQVGRKLSESDQLQQLENDLKVLPHVPVVTPVISSIMQNLQKIFQIPDSSEASLLSGIAIKMKALSFDKNDVDQEIAMLKNISVADLKVLYPKLYQELQERLSKKSFYINTPSLSSTVSLFDHAAQLVHKFATSVAMVAGLGLSCVGHHSSFATDVAASLLLDPRLTYFKELTKKDFLELLYVHYDSFVTVRDVYLDPDYLAERLMSRANIVSAITDDMQKLGFSLQDMQQFAQNHEKSSLQDMQFLHTWFGKLAHDNVELQGKDKHIAKMNRSQLTKGIKSLLLRKKMIGRKADLYDLKDLDIGQLQNLYQDLQGAASGVQGFSGFESKKEQLLKYIIKNQPMLVEYVKPFLLDRIKNDLIQKGKGKAYVLAKMQHLESLQASPSYNFIHFSHLQSYENY